MANPHPKPRVCLRNFKKLKTKRDVTKRDVTMRDVAMRDVMLCDPPVVQQTTGAVNYGAR